jgi:hypothetical protein
MALQAPAIRSIEPHDASQTRVDCAAFAEIFDGRRETLRVFENGVARIGSRVGLTDRSEGRMLSQLFMIHAL